jgi:predicted nucleic acid-binding protein
MIMIDTDIVIWILRKKPEVKAKFDQVVIDAEGKVYVTPIQVAEIYAGIRDAERIETAEFFRALHHLPIDEGIGQQAGEFLRQYQKSHHVTLADAMIAAVSLVHHLKLWTLNKKHYPMLSTEHFLS